MTAKRKNTKPTEESIKTGNVSGTGNVVGDHSSSHVTFTKTISYDKENSGSGKSQRLMWAKLAAFLVAMAGIALFIILIVRLTSGLDASTVLELILAALVTALGVSGIIKPQALVDLFSKLFGKN